MNPSGNITLAIDSAICGGSISLLRDGSQVENWIGSSHISKAEELLDNIDAMLTQNNISRNEIDLIAVSAGPGSFTGIRIGWATALGLKAGLGIEMSSESALKAMVFAQPEDRKILAAVPVGRNAVCVQQFSKVDGAVSAIDHPTSLTEDQFAILVQNKKNSFVVHDTLFEKLNSSPNIINFGSNIAYALGMMCRADPGNVTAPLFISKCF